MKIDKEFVIKNHFWFLLGAAVVLSLTGWAILLVSVPSKVGAKRTEIETAWKSAKDYNGFKHKDYVRLAKEEADARNKERGNIHENLYHTQVKEAKLNTWPDKMVKTGGFDFNAGRYATEITIKAPKTTLESLPADDATHIHGKLTNKGESAYIVIQIRDGKDFKELKIVGNPDSKIVDEGKTNAKEFADLHKRAVTEGNRVVAVTFGTGRFFGDKLTQSEITAFVESYRDQLAEVVAEAGPLNALGQPIVQFRYGGEGGKGGAGFNERPFIPGGLPMPKGGGSKGGFESKEKETDPELVEEGSLGGETWIYHPGKLPPSDNRFFPFVSKWDSNYREISEEIWTAQENVWIQRELFKRVKMINDAVAQCAFVDLKYPTEVVVQSAKSDLKKFPDSSTRITGKLAKDSDPLWFQVVANDGKVVKFLGMSHLKIVEGPDSKVTVKYDDLRKNMVGRTVTVHFTNEPANEAKADLNKYLSTRNVWLKFKNFYWEIELMVTDEGVKARLTNVRPRPQDLDGLSFLVQFSNYKDGKDKTDAQLFPPKDAKDVGFFSVPVAPGESYTTPNAIALPAGTKLEGIFAVHQVLTWKTAAIKRIDVVNIGAGANGDPAVSHRQAWMSLQPYKKKAAPPKDEKDDKDNKEGTKGDGGKGGDYMPKGQGGKGYPPNMGGPNTPGGPGVAGEMGGKHSKHGLLLERYLEVTPELRKVPINMVLIVDPEHIAKVEKAFAESPLRFLTTQVLWQRCQVALQPPDPKSAVEAPDTGGPGGLKQPYPRGPGSPYGLPQPPAADTPAAGGDEQENVELTIYGVITLYERPGRPTQLPTEERK